jgi:hypothetical protein
MTGVRLYVTCVYTVQQNSLEISVGVGFWCGGWVCYRNRFYKPVGTKYTGWLYFVYWLNDGGNDITIFQ